MSKKEKRNQEQEINKIQKRSLKERPYKMNPLYRIFNLIIGLAFVGFPGFIVYEEIIIDTAILILGGIVLISGLQRIFSSFYDENVGGTKRIFRLIFGLIIVIFGLLIFIDVGFGEDTIFLIIGLAILFQGIDRIFIGFSHPVIPFWFKSVLILLGILSVLIGASVFVIEASDREIINLLSAGFVISGIGRIGRGIVGYSLTENIEN